MDREKWYGIKVVIYMRGHGWMENNMGKVDFRQGI
jgi:hypothetical protein